MKVNQTPATNKRLGSPTWRWNHVTITGRPAPIGSVRRSRSAPAFPAWRSKHRPLWTELSYRGGAQGEVEVFARGWRFVFPADVAIYDVLSCINGHPPKAQ